MLTLTEGATEAIHGLVGDRPGVGLRIFPRAVDRGEMQLALSLSEHPEPTDEVVEQSGCQVFLDQQVAPLVDGRTLDAVKGDEQEYRFAFAD
jgi:Fe-S cluster assembly iron-binding protein IscA